jgi:hypothetical protein
MNMVPRNTGETPTFEAGCKTRISRPYTSIREDNTCEGGSRSNARVSAVVSQYLKGAKPKCKIKHDVAGDDKTMFVRTS